MNTKIIVALVLGIALVGLTGAASAGYYYIDGNYVYADGEVNAGPSDSFSAYTDFEVELQGFNPDGEYMYMHNWVDNLMIVSSASSPSTNVNFGFVQGGESTLTIETDLPGNLNTFVSEDVAFQNVNYAANGDAFDINFYGDSITHASTHEGILPIEEMAVWDFNMLDANAHASGYWDANGIWVQEASIKDGDMGYVCTAYGEALMEAEHVLEPVNAGSGITAWSNTNGEIWEPYGTISNDLDAYQQVYMWWP